MAKGFFIAISSGRESTRRRKGGQADWKSVPVEELHGWSCIRASSLEEIIELQKERYKWRKGASQRVPHLVSITDGPIASGKITRFVPIEC